MKIKIKSKNKKVQQTPYYSPVFINTGEKEPRSALITRMMIKVFLVCLCASGLGLTLAQVYRVPVSASAVILTCFTSVILFNVGLIFFKKRAVLIPILAISVFDILILDKSEEIVHDVSMFITHMLYTLDSRLLSTAKFAFYSRSYLENWTNQESIATVFLVICVVLSYIFAVGARSRFIGLMLILTVFLLTPAFSAEIAGFVPGMIILIMGMVGIYSAWVAHAWENSNGIHQINYSNKDGINELGGTSKDYKKAISEEKKKSKKSENSNTSNTSQKNEPFYKITPGRLPFFYKYSYNAIVAGFLAGVSVLIAVSAVPAAVKFDYNTIIQAVKDFPVKVPNSIQRFFKYNFSSINDNGFFPGISKNISTGINMGKPPSGNIPIIRISVENDSEKLYLRGGIGIDLNGGEWTIVKDSDEYRQLVELLKDFSPELEYHVFRQKRQYINNLDPYSRDNSNPFGVQDIKVEYLAKTGFLLLPMSPYYTDFKSNSNYTYHGDTFIRPNGKISSTTFDTLYPKTNNMDFLYNEYRNVILNGAYGLYMDEDGNPVEPDYLYDDITWNFPSDRDPTTREYNEKIIQYRDLINAVYMDIPDNEIANIDRLLGEIGFAPRVEFPEFTPNPNPLIDDIIDESQAIIDPDASWGDYDTGFTNKYAQIFHTSAGNIDAMSAARVVDEYLRTRYAYSLKTDNSSAESGGNTTIGNFLFETKKGHCAMYASSMTLAMRRLGLPTRYVTGLVTVAREGEESDFGYEYAMAERDFHAWVEVYFEDLGWVPFDPTGGANGNDGGNVTIVDVPGTQTVTAVVTTAVTPPMSSPPTSAATTAPSSAATSAVTTTESEGSTAVSNPINVKLILIIAGSILAVCAVVFGCVTFFKRLNKAEESKLTRFRNGGKDGGDFNKTAEEMYRFMFKLLKYKGIRTTKGEPPLDFGRRVDSAFSEAAEGEVPFAESSPLSDVMPIFEKLEFSDGQTDENILTKEEYDSLYKYVSALYEKVISESRVGERLVRKYNMN
ncbi:MAG: transglutaminase-like domain-containing protein [Oscillospiraceae bacterium]|nr:transglutaminase-like domain-containing protein [Oscillospiraceae bacterium]